ncbi:MAG: hypothetical protein K5979_13685 [Ruminococcus sp.]|nr:hypothetical protein [Ruminococcus sp.]
MRKEKRFECRYKKADEITLWEWYGLLGFKGFTNALIRGFINNYKRNKKSSKQHYTYKNVISVNKDDLNEQYYFWHL